jgi:hypothetical protein
MGSAVRRSVDPIRQSVVIRRIAAGALDRRDAGASGCLLAPAWEPTAWLSGSLAPAWEPTAHVRMSFIFALALRVWRQSLWAARCTAGAMERGIEKSLGLPSKQLLPDKE